MHTFITSKSMKVINYVNLVNSNSPIKNISE
jgi:hypothetical protein